MWFFVEKKKKSTFHGTVNVCLNADKVASFFSFFKSETCTAVHAAATGETSCRSFRGERRTSRVIQNHNSLRKKNKTFDNVNTKLICATAEAGLKSKGTPASGQMEDIRFLMTIV